MSNSEVFLDIAKADLKAAQCLYQAKSYPQAVSYLQQSVEKTFKALGALNDNLTIDELKFNIGHHPLGVLGFMMEKFQGALTSNNYNKQSDYVKNVVESDELKEFLKNTGEIARVFKNRKLFEKLPTSEILKFLPKLLSKKIRFGLLQKSRLEIDAKLKLFITSYSISNNKRDIVDSKTLISYINNILEAIWEAELILTVLSLLFPPSCLEKTRYPTQDSDPLKIYTGRHPIVRSFRQIASLCKIAQRGVRKASKKVAKLELDSD